MKIIVKLEKKCDQSYPIFIEAGITNKIPAYLLKEKIGRKFAIITDSKVNKLYAQAFARYLKKYGIHCEVFSFEQGEKSKVISTVEKICDEMVEKQFDRKDAIIAYGGGVVGDLAGFVASIYMRGIPFIQVPTTLLAMVDSSVGGKTGVDLKSGKNLAGSFYQPKAVFIDINHLASLAEKQLRSGLAEVIKYGVIKDKTLFSYLEKNREKIFARETAVMNKIIEQSVKIKAAVVESDEKEQGERMILNYGHSFGHAIEKMSDYTLLHGYAISIGMVMINKLAQKQGLLSEKDAERIKKLIKDFGLPTTTMHKPTMKDLLSDKKKEGDKIKLILPSTIGKVIIKEESCQ